MALASHNSLVSNTSKIKSIDPILRDFILVIFGSILLAISAQYKVPLFPVPATLQSFVVMLIGTVYGWRLGAATILAYWFEGIAVGILFSFLPWFANGSGLAYFLTAPTAGFLWGFLPMVLIIGYLSDNFEFRKSPLMLMIALIMGQIFLYAFGLAQAYLWILPAVNWMSNTDDLLSLYLYPFIFGDLLKTFLASMLTWEIANRVLKY